MKIGEKMKMKEANFNAHTSLYTIPKLHTHIEIFKLAGKLNLT